jgi:hypothetical protein
LLPLPFYPLGGQLVANHHCKDEGALLCDC